MLHVSDIQTLYPKQGVSDAVIDFFVRSVLYYIIVDTDAKGSTEPLEARSRVLLRGQRDLAGFYLEILVWGGRGHGTFMRSPLPQTINRYLWVLGVAIYSLTLI